MDNISREEFNKFLAELRNSLMKAGLSDDAITTAIAEAIKKREDSLATDKVERVEYVPRPEVQVLYGPPPMEKVEIVDHVQILYGPPPDVEKHEIHHK